MSKPRVLDTEKPCPKCGEQDWRTVPAKRTWTRKDGTTVTRVYQAYQCRACQRAPHRKCHGCGQTNWRIAEYPFTWTPVGGTPITEVYRKPVCQVCERSKAA